MDSYTKHTKKSLLLALIKEAEAEFSSTGRPVLDIEEYVAEKLIENGVDIPLTNVGDKLCADTKKDTTVDMVEVIRCRNCEYHYWEQEPCHGKTEHFCSKLHNQVFADFYCQYGKRKN